MAGKKLSAARAGKKGGLLLALFGLPFLAFGCFALYQTASLLTEWQSAKQWVETPADILSVDLEQHHDSDGGTTYEAVCTYRYAFEGEAYRSDRVGLKGGSDNIGDWQQVTHAKLKAAQEQGEHVICYVNPNYPKMAVLFRELRPGMLGLWFGFGAVFATAGIGLVCAGIYAKGAAAKADCLRNMHPDQPWMWNENWARARIPAATKLKAVTLWIITIFWNGISSTVVFLIVAEAVLKEHQYWLLIFLIFPLIGIGLLIAAIRATIRHFKFGRSCLELKTLPGIIGGHFRGNLVLAGKIADLRTVDATLTCVRSVTTGTGKHRSTTKTTLWETTEQIEAVSVFRSDRASLPIDFEIPEGSQPSDDSDVRNKVDWTLKTTADLPGVDLNLEFKVPVFNQDA